MPHKSLARTPSSTSRTESSTSKGKSGSHLWVVVGDPTELKDRNTLREARKFVMKRWLDNERLNPNSTDRRVTGEPHTRKKQGSRRSPPKGTPLAPSSQDSPTATRTAQLGPGSEQDRSSTSQEDLTLKEVRSDSPDPRECKKIARRSTASRSLSEDSIKAGFQHGVPNGSYMSTSINDVPFNSARLGTNVNPFDTWPEFDDLNLDVTNLKWRCEYLRFLALLLPIKNGIDDT